MKTFCTKDELSIIFETAKESILKYVIGKYGIRSMFVFFTSPNDRCLFETPWDTDDDMIVGMAEAQKVAREFGARGVISLAEGDTLFTIVAYNGRDIRWTAFEPIRKGKKGKIVDLVRVCPDIWTTPNEFKALPGFEDLITIDVPLDVPAVGQLTIH